MSLADRQSAASRQGREFQQLARTTLQIEGWTILREHWVQPDVGVEIDIVAVDPDRVEWWIECKGSWESPTRNGLQRTDSTKKALFNGAMLRLVPDRCPFMILTSHPPRLGSAGTIWIERALGLYVDAVKRIGTV